MSAQNPAALRSERMRAKYGPWAVIAGASEGTGAEYARQLAACRHPLSVGGAADRPAAADRTRVDRPVPVCKPAY